LKDIANLRYNYLNIEQGISNDEVWNRYALSFYILKIIEYLTSTFIIPYSIFCGWKQTRKFDFYQKVKYIEQSTTYAKFVQTSYLKVVTMSLCNTVNQNNF